MNEHPPIIVKVAEPWIEPATSLADPVLAVLTPHFPRDNGFLKTQAQDDKGLAITIERKRSPGALIVRDRRSKRDAGKVQVQFITDGFSATDWAWYSFFTSSSALASYAVWGFITCAGLAAATVHKFVGFVWLEWLGEKPMSMRLILSVGPFLGLFFFIYALFWLRWRFFRFQLNNAELRSIENSVEKEYSV